MKNRCAAARLCWPLVFASFAAPAFAAVHVWQKQELTLTSARAFANPYTT